MIYLDYIRYLNKSKPHFLGVRKLIHMGMWVQLTKPLTLEVNGVKRNYKSGDWIEVGKQTAIQWINQDKARRVDFNPSDEYVDLTAGIVLVGSVNKNLLDNIKHDIPGIEVTNSELPEMKFSENMIWVNGVKLKRENVGVGFKLLKNWQMAVPLHSYDDLIVHQKMKRDEKEYLTSVLHDLRVPFYNTNLIFVRRCSETKELFEQWQLELEQIENTNLAFHVAYYKVKPVLCALPVSWCE